MDVAYIWQWMAGIEWVHLMYTAT